MVTGNDNKTQENRDYKVMKDPVTLWSSLRPSFVHSVSPIHFLSYPTYLSALSFVSHSFAS